MMDFTLLNEQETISVIEEERQVVPSTRNSYSYVRHKEGRDTEASQFNTSQQSSSKNFLEPTGMSVSSSRQ